MFGLQHQISQHLTQQLEPLTADARKTLKQARDQMSLVVIFTYATLIVSIATLVAVRELVRRG